MSDTDRILYFDIETAAGDVPVAQLRPIEANKTLKDPDKVAADILKKSQQQLDEMSLDPYACRIVAIGVNLDGHEAAYLAPDEAHERIALQAWWRMAADRPLCGFNCKRFDLPVLITRSWLLGVTFPFWMQAPDFLRRSRTVIDLYDYVTHGQSSYGSGGVISRGLMSLCARFGIDIPADDISGSGIADAVRCGQWDAVRTHVLRDVQRTVALAQRLRVAETPAVVTAEARQEIGAF